MVWQFVSITGAVLILIAYTAHQLKKMNAHTVLYQMLNLLGGVCLFSTALVERQYGFILMEGAWSVLSLVGLVKVLRE
jgi:hypothetical protein